MVNTSKSTDDNLGKLKGQEKSARKRKDKSWKAFKLAEQVYEAAKMNPDIDIAEAEARYKKTKKDFYVNHGQYTIILAKIGASQPKDKTKDVSADDFAKTRSASQSRQHERRKIKNPVVVFECTKPN